MIGVAPRWGARRVQARLAASMAVRRFEAASGGRRTSGWRRSSGDANSSNGPALVALRELSRDLRRNNGWAKRGLEKIATNTVGWGIQPKLGAGKAAIEIWNQWARSSRCDADGRLNFYGLQRLAMETIAESGEVLILRRYVSSAEAGALPVGMQIKLIEPDHLDTSKDGIKSEAGGRTLQGIEFDSRGRRVAYWLFPDHPGGAPVIGKSFASVRVPAADVIHVYRQDRTGQARGVPWLASAIAKLNDFDDYEDAVLMQQKVAACFAAFVQDMDGLATPLGDQDPASELVESLEPGRINYLPAGKSVSFATPPSVADHKTFTTTNLHRIAAALGVTYEDLTGDYSTVNFSSARMSRLSHYQHVHDWRWNMLIPQLCDGVWGWVMEYAVELGRLRELPVVTWAPPPMPMLEPEKEGLAIQRLVRSGARTLFQVIEEQGEDPIAHLDELQRVNQELDARDLTLDSDARRTSAAGLAQQGGDSEGGGFGGRDKE